MEKFVLKGTEITAPVPMAPPGTTGLGGFEVPSSKGGTLRSDASALNVGVLHLVPTLDVFPLLADPKTYVYSVLLPNCSIWMMCYYVNPFSLHKCICGTSDF